MELLPQISKCEQGNFYCQAQKIFLTYPTHIDKILLQNLLSKAATKRDGTERIFKFFRVAHETGHANGVDYPHSHVLIDFGSRFQSKNARIFDIKIEDTIIHPSWRFITSTNYWNNCVKYIAKEDPENKDLIVKTCLAEEIWACENKQDALKKFVNNPSDVIGVTALYAAKPSETIPYDGPIPDYPWQIKIRDIISEKPDASSVYWIFDPWGQNGKSTLCEYLEHTGEANSSGLDGGSTGLSHIIRQTFEAGELKSAWLFDVTRTFTERDIYNIIEQMKNGKITSPKYNGGCIRFKKPHVIVFANFLPNIQALSYDRWKIHQIINHNLYRLNTFKLLQHPEYGMSRSKGVPPGLANVLEKTEVFPSNEEQGKSSEITGAPEEDYSAFPGVGRLNIKESRPEWKAEENEFRQDIYDVLDELYS